MGRLPRERASLLRIVRPLRDGLEVVLRAGFLHRDVKPGNIYMRADGSPVLLDFGSARRIEHDAMDQALTAVVSPGFAPAEQYHRHGKQGPWTDLYALAGVMYWMVTGRLPLEALARLREDGMPAAARIGNVTVFGIGLLNAIDWALKPDESARDHYGFSLVLRHCDPLLPVQYFQRNLYFSACARRLLAARIHRASRAAVAVPASETSARLNAGVSSR